MDTRFRPLRAVVFVVFCLALAVVTYALVLRVDWGGATKVTVRFASVGTIQPGSPVRQSGVKVGSVSSVSLAPDDRSKVDVTLSLYRGAVVRTGDKVSIVTGGLLGDQYIDVQTGSPDAPVVGAQDLIPGESGLDLKELVGGGTGLLTDLRSTTQTIARFLDRHEADVDAILVDARRGVKAAADAAEKADRLLGRAEATWDPTVKDVRSTLTSLKEASASLKTLVDGLGTPGAVAGLLSSPKTAQSAAETLANLQAASKNLKTVTDALEASLR
jgi:ABC-type transporter Mla subunit MlaD